MMSQVDFQKAKATSVEQLKKMVSYFLHAVKQLKRWLAIY